MTKSYITEIPLDSDTLDEIGFIRLERTGKSKSFVAYVNRGVCSVRVATIAVNYPNALQRAKDCLAKYKPLSV